MIWHFEKQLMLIFFLLVGHDILLLHHSWCWYFLQFSWTYSIQLHCAYMCCIENRKCFVYVTGVLNSQNLQKRTCCQTSQFFEFSFMHIIRGSFSFLLKNDSYNYCQARKIVGIFAYALYKRFFFFSAQKRFLEIHKVNT